MTESDIDDIDIFLATAEKTQRTNYCVEIPHALFEQINKHVRVLKRLKNKELSKNAWIQEAIVEYLRNSSDSEILEKSWSVKNLNLNLEENVDRDLEDKVFVVKKHGGRLSKKKVILEAIEARLQKEHETILKLIKNASLK